MRYRENFQHNLSQLFYVTGKICSVILQIIMGPLPRGGTFLWFWSPFLWFYLGSFFSLCLTFFCPDTFMKTFYEGLETKNLN